jgi:cell division protein FtsZ
MNLSMSSNPIRQTPISTRLPVLKVLGLGGGGCNAINRMIELGLKNIEFIAANTDHQALERCLATKKVHLGPKVTRGLGAGGNPAIGEAAAEESYRELGEALAGADMVFLTAGMGGGTGTGAISVAARVARSIGAIVVAVVTTPFSFEMGRRSRNAQEGLAKLRPFTDTLITVPNDRLLYVAPRDLSLDLTFRLADDVLRQGIQGITELVTEPGLINVDFAHVRRLMQMGGGSIMSIGYGQGEDKARKAIEQALHHPLLESICMSNAQGIIANFTGGSDLTFLEVVDALNFLQDESANQAEIIPGVINNENMQDRTQVILIITGLGGTPIDQTISGAENGFEKKPAVAASVPTEKQPVAAAAPTKNAASAEVPAMELDTNPATNLDLPAFMRRRVRYAG